MPAPYSRFRYARALGVPLERFARVVGWGHRTAGLPLDQKLAKSQGEPYVLPHLRRAILDALARAHVEDAHALDGIETHDCFTITEYLAIDHFGLTPPGQSFRAIEDRSLERGHPVGATGVRMVHDAARQTTARAGDMQIEGARRVATLNIGGSGTTVVSFVVAGWSIE